MLFLIPVLLPILSPMALQVQQTRTYQLITLILKFKEKEVKFLLFLILQLKHFNRELNFH